MVWDLIKCILSVALSLVIVFTPIISDSPFSIFCIFICFIVFTIGTIIQIDSITNRRTKGEDDLLDNSNHKK